MSSLFSNQKITRGFTLIELMITVGIFIFMTTLIMARYNSFYSGTIFKNIAYDIALTIRQAQTYGISVKVNDAASFTSAYGVQFTSGNSKVFTLYPYSKSSGVYTNGATEKAYSIKQGAKITSICVISSSSSCDILIGNYSLDIIFQRPNPEAIICATVSGSTDCSKKFARITITSGDGTATRDIEVNNVGQISVK